MEEKLNQLINHDFLEANKENGYIDSWDLMAGDNIYVFLSLDKRYIRFNGGLSYGLIFPAKQLIEQCNAILGLEDLADDYSWMVLKALDSVYSLIPKDSIVPCEAAGMIHSEVNYMPIKKRHLYFAALSKRFDLPGVKEFQDEFRKLISPIHKEKRITGKNAIEFLNNFQYSPKIDKKPPEILVPNSLPVSLAVGKIIKGEEILF